MDEMRLQTILETVKAHEEQLAATEDYEIEIMRQNPDDEALIGFIEGRQAERTAVALTTLSGLMTRATVVVEPPIARPSPSFVVPAVSDKPSLPPDLSAAKPSAPSVLQEANKTSSDSHAQPVPVTLTPSLAAVPTATPSVTDNAIATFIADAESLELTTYEDIFSGSYTPSPSDEPPSMIFAKGVIFDCWMLQGWYAEEKSYSHLADTMSWYFDIGERRNNFDSDEARIALKECGCPVR